MPTYPDVVLTLSEIPDLRRHNYVLIGKTMAAVADAGGTVAELSELKEAALAVENFDEVLAVCRQWVTIEE